MAHCSYNSTHFSLNTYVVFFIHSRGVPVNIPLDKRLPFDKPVCLTLIRTIPSLLRLAPSPPLLYPRYEHMVNQQVERFNGHKVENLAHLARLVLQSNDADLRFDLASKSTIVLQRPTAFA